MAGLVSSGTSIKIGTLPASSIGNEGNRNIREGLAIFADDRALKGAGVCGENDLNAVRSPRVNMNPAVEGIDGPEADRLHVSARRQVADHHLIVAVNQVIDHELTGRAELGKHVPRPSRDPSEFFLQTDNRVTISGSTGAQTFRNDVAGNIDARRQDQRQTFHIRTTDFDGDTCTHDSHSAAVIDTQTVG